LGNKSNSNNNRNSRSKDGNDDEQVAGIHASETNVEPETEPNDQSEDAIDPNVATALAAVQEGGDEDPNYFSPLQVEDIDFEDEQVAGIHIGEEVLDNITTTSSEDNSQHNFSSNSYTSSVHLSDHFYCLSGSDDSSYRSMPGLQEKDQYAPSSDDDSDYNNDDGDDTQNEPNDGLSVAESIGQSINDSTISPITTAITQDAFEINPPVPLLALEPIDVFPNSIDVPNGNTTNSIPKADPSGCIPIRLNQHTMYHVDDIC